jgi:hypothetical protein
MKAAASEEDQDETLQLLTPVPERKAENAFEAATSFDSTHHSHDNASDDRQSTSDTNETQANGDSNNWESQSETENAQGEDSDRERKYSQEESTPPQPQETHNS